MKIKTCLITGGNSGIGKAAAIQIASRGYKVFIGCRNEERGKQAVESIRDASENQEVEMLIIDLSLKESIMKAAKDLKNQLDQLDVLIHNAADFDISRKLRELTTEGVERVWATNHLGPVLLTSQLQDLITASDQGRILTIASKGLLMFPKLEVDLEDPEFKNRKYTVTKAYYQSKLAQVMYTYWLADELKGTGTTVNCIRVTNVKIDLDRYPGVSGFNKFLYSIKSAFSLSPERMADTYTLLATGENLEQVSGKYFDEKNKIVSSSPYSRDKENIMRVMDLTKSYL